MKLYRYCRTHGFIEAPPQPAAPQGNPLFPFTCEEERGTSFVDMGGGRKVWVPTEVYLRIHDAGFRQGVAWARDHPEGKS